MTTYITFGTVTGNQLLLLHLVPQMLSCIMVLHLSGIGIGIGNWTDSNTFGNCC